MQTRRTTHRLSTILCARDKERQASGDFADVRRDAALALLVLACQARVQLSDKQRAGLALIVHHGGSVHDLRSAKHMLADRVLAVDHILLYRQISDRIQIMHGRPQIYGTQWKVDKTTGATKPFPLRTRQMTASCFRRDQNLLQ